VRPCRLSTAEAIQREVRIAYEARPRPPAPDFDPATGSVETRDWLCAEAAAMHAIAERLIPTGWIWGIQMEVFPPGARLVLDDSKRTRKR
jgi:hypothetical protein